MKYIITILLFTSYHVFSQIDSMKANTLYIDSYNIANRILDSINSNNNYPRQHADYYCYYEYDSVIKKYSILINKPTQRYLQNAVLTVYDLPTIRIPVNNLTAGAKTTLENRIINENWNTYIQNNNIWLFHFNKSADDLFTQSQRNYILSIEGELFNFN